jgi:hypothetical protein
MMLIVHLILSIQIYTFCRLFRGVNALEAVSRAQLLPDGFFALGDYDVLSTRQEGDEDVVHIRKREDEDCGTDCIEYNSETLNSDCIADDEDTEDADKEDADKEDADTEDALEKRAKGKGKGRKSPECVFQG